MVCIQALLSEGARNVRVDNQPATASECILQMSARPAPVQIEWMSRA